MIKSEIVKIKKIKDFDNLYIENELSKLYKSVIRWAIISIDNEQRDVDRCQYSFRG